jgi:hypothetical protein
MTDRMRRGCVTVLLASLVSVAAAGCHSNTDAKQAKKQMTTTKDLDLDQLIGWFGNPYVNSGLPVDDAFRVVESFRGAKGFVAPVNEEIWFGKSYDVALNGASDYAFVFMRVRRDPSGAASACVANLVTQSGEEDGEARRLFGAVKRGEPAPADSDAAKYIRTAQVTRPFAAIVDTEGTSKVIIDEPPRFIRQTPDRVLLIQAVASHATPQGTPLRGSGRYAELWKLR